ncbi:unnamed protein product [Caenorhabditis brenneri]
MAVAPSFPLYELPKDELRWVIRFMDPNALFKLSLLSKRSKDLVTSRNWKAVRITILVSQSIQIRCSLNRFSGVICYLQTDNSSLKKIINPSEISILEPSRERKRYQWKIEGFEAMDWVNHFRTIFHQKEITFSLFRDASQFDLDSLCQQFPAVPSFLGLQECVDFDFNNRVLKMLAPKQMLLVSTAVFENKTTLHEALVQNIDELDIGGSDQKLTLDGLLCSNSKRIRSDVWRISSNVLNKFLKLWKSGSNSRLEQLCVSFIDLQGLEVLMKGIPHRVVSREENEQRRFKLSNGRIEALEGEGMDFNRFDGTKATVCIKERDTWAFLYFYVWHDHCIVNKVL